MTKLYRMALGMCLAILSSATVAAANSLGAGNEAPFPVTGNIEVISQYFTPGYFYFDVSGGAFSADGEPDGSLTFMGPSGGQTAQAYVNADTNGLDDFGLPIVDDGTLNGVSGTVTGFLNFQTTQAYTPPSDISDYPWTISGLPGIFSGTLTAYADIDGGTELGPELWDVNLSGTGTISILYQDPTDVFDAGIDIVQGTGTVPEPETWVLLAMVLISFGALALLGQTRFGIPLAHHRSRV